MASTSNVVQYTISSRASGQKAKEALNLYCDQQKLGLGVHAVATRTDPLEYFKRYGLNIRAFSGVCNADPTFQLRVVGEMKPEEALTQYGKEHSLTVRWCPYYIHVMERIKIRYPSFSWTIVHADNPTNGNGRPYVTYRNYPRLLLEGGRVLTPTLHDLVTGNVWIAPGYIFVQPEKQKRSRRRRGRHSFVK